MASNRPARDRSFLPVTYVPGRLGWLYWATAGLLQRLSLGRQPLPKFVQL